MRSNWTRAAAAAAVGAIVALLGGCGSAGEDPAGTAQPVTVPEVRVPLDGSVATSGGTWVVVEMGHLDQLVSTFWQLFVLREGGSRWSLVTPPGFADNGGIVATPGKGESLVTGFEASQLIAFSPLATTSDWGSTWAPGILGHALSSVPDAVAASTTGEMLALAGGRARTILSSKGNLSAWQELVSEKSLAATAIGRSCAVTKLTAVAFAPGGDAIVGTTCAQPGQVGIFEDEGGTWRSFAPRLPASMKDATTEVVRLTSANRTVAAIIAARTGSHTVLFGARVRPGQAQWSISGALGLAHSDQLVSSGIDLGGGVFVSLSSAGSERVEVQSGSTGSWTQLPTVPDGTEAIAFASRNRVNAFVVRSSVLTVYALDAKQGMWRRSQVINVPIAYGSSS